MAWRPPSVNELYSNGLHHGTASYEIGDSTLESEQGYKWITTASWHNDKLSVALTGYLHWFRNFIYLAPAMKYITPMQGRDRKSVVSGKSVSVRVALGGRRILKK